MKIKLYKFLITGIFLSIALFIIQTQICYASEVLGTLSTGAQAPTQAQSSATNPPQNNLASIANSSTINNAVSNLLGTGNNSAVMLEGIAIGALLTFFVGLLIFMIVLFIKRGRKKNITVI